MSARRLQRSALALVLAVLATGCATWRPASLPVDQVVTRPDPPERISVHLKSGQWLVVAKPVVLADSLVGLTYGKSVSRQRPAQRVAIALADVDSVRVERIHAGRTVLLVVVLVGIALLLTAYQVGAPDLSGWSALP